jgi:hypothetical protein
MNPDKATHWTCPHGTDARRGCEQCHLEGEDHQPPSPLWQVAIRFATERPVPLETLRAISRHPRGYSIVEETFGQYLLASGPRAPSREQAVADVVGMIAFDLNPEVIGRVVVTEVAAQC